MKHRRNRNGNIVFLYYKLTFWILYKVKYPSQMTTCIIFFLTIVCFVHGSATDCASSSAKMGCYEDTVGWKSIENGYTVSNLVLTSIGGFVGTNVATCDSEVTDSWGNTDRDDALFNWVVNSQLDTGLMRVQEGDYYRIKEAGCTCTNGTPDTDCSVEENKCALCDDGYYLDGTSCYFDDCAITDPCSGNGQCIDGISAYSCDCDSGWTGSACSIVLEGCPHHQYMDGTSCVPCPSTTQGYTTHVARTSVSSCYDCSTFAEFYQSTGCCSDKIKHPACAGSVCNTC